MGPFWRLIAIAVVASTLATGTFALLDRPDEVSCPPIASDPDWSAPRRWNEATLNAIRRDLPAPTVHARNLFHTSAAMWDAWAAYDEAATGYLYTESHNAGDVETARVEAMSHAAFAILEARYLQSIGAEGTITEIIGLMEALCLDRTDRSVDGNSPSAVGNRIAELYLEAGLSDGANEADGYLDPDYEPANPPLTVVEAGAAMNDPNRWQPLQIESMISQNGIPVENGVQEFIDSHWGGVSGFALPAGPFDPPNVPIDPGPPPYLGDAETDLEFKLGAIEVIRYSSLLDPVSAPLIDISPASLGAIQLGTYEGVGYDANPVTGEPYPPNTINEADFARALAEFWADGPDSETPPGHWNTLANTVSDQVDPDLRIGGSGEPVDRIEWDVKLYFALNGAMHDAAIAAWGTKGHYDYVRPISMIRYMGGLGQSTNPTAPSYHPQGLVLVNDLIEVVTESTTVPGGRHERLAGHEGEIAIRAWTGVIGDPETETAGVDWIRSVEWVPYQQPSFVTPAFAGYVSGHSTFSRAGAQILTGITGSEYFPGGLGAWTIAAGSLEFEAGPSSDITLQWASYADAADQAGLSRLYGGIHVPADDLAGRIMGAAIGDQAWDKARSYF